MDVMLVGIQRDNNSSILYSDSQTVRASVANITVLLISCCCLLLLLVDWWLSVINAVTATVSAETARLSADLVTFM